MTFVSCSVQERYVNPLFEVFDGGDFVLSSYRDIEEPRTRLRIFLEDASQAPAAEKALRDALEVVGVNLRKGEDALATANESTKIEVGEIADEDWKFAYRRHFKTELVSPRILVQPEWEEVATIRFDPGLAFGTGKHETTKACLQYIDELSADSSFRLHPSSFLDMGCGSGILSIAAAKLGYTRVRGFDVDQEAVDASMENAAKNGVDVEYFRYGLGANVKRDLGTADLVVANILGPLLIRFADEIAPCATHHLVISGILTTLYPEVLAAFAGRGFAEVSRKTLGEWTTGLLVR